MQLTARQRYFIRIFATALLISIAIGALFSHTSAPQLGMVAYLHGAVSGALIAAPLVLLEFFVFDRRRLRQAPFLLALGLRSLAYLAVILVGLAVPTLLVADLGSGVLAVERGGVIFSFAVALGFNLFFSVNRLLGPGVLLRFVAGRYNRPRIEQRVLLFVDMESSTAIAERLGETRFFDFLNRFVADVSGPLVARGGEIHKYVGDELIVTWPPAGGTRSIAACFDALATLDALAAGYERDFGRRANFRAALHCGPVVVGELGVIKQEIALLGDSMNTTARLLEACRETGNRVLASGALMERVAALPPGIAQRAIGRVHLRGREQAIEAHALHPMNAAEAVASPVALA